LQNTPGLSGSIAHLGLSFTRICWDRPMSGLVVVSLGAQVYGRASMRTTGGGVVQVRSGISGVRIDVDGYGRRRRGCCTLVLHTGIDPDA